MRLLGPAALLAIAAAAIPAAPAIGQSGPKAIADGSATAEIVPVQLSLTQGTLNLNASVSAPDINDPVPNNNASSYTVNIVAP